VGAGSFIGRGGVKRDRFCQGRPVRKLATYGRRIMVDRNGGSLLRSAGAGIELLRMEHGDSFACSRLCAAGRIVRSIALAPSATSGAP
jgi:hypothetical protein